MTDCTRGSFPNGDGRDYSGADLGRCVCGGYGSERSYAFNYSNSGYSLKSHRFGLTKDTHSFHHENAQSMEIHISKYLG